MSSIVSEIESLFTNLRAKVGGLSAETEGHMSAAIASAKAEEDAADVIRAKVQAEIDHLTALGYSVVKAVST